MLPDVADRLFLKWEKMSAGILDNADKQNNWRQYLRLTNEEPHEGNKYLIILYKKKFLSLCSCVEGLLAR